MFSINFSRKEIYALIKLLNIYELLSVGDLRPNCNLSAAKNVVKFWRKKLFYFCPTKIQRFIWQQARSHAHKTTSETNFKIFSRKKQRLFVLCSSRETLYNQIPNILLTYWHETLDNLVGWRRNKKKTVALNFCL